MKICLWFSLLLLLGVAAVPAVKVTKTPQIVKSSSQGAGYRINDSVNNFSLKGTNGTTVSLTDFNNSKGLIVIFTSNHCPFAKAYEDRIIALHHKYASQNFPVIAINPSDPITQQDDTMDKMKERATFKNYPHPYLADHNQQTAKAFGVQRAPQAYILQRDGGKFVVKYIGMIDDSPQDQSGASKFYIEDAVNNILSDKPVVTTTTRPIGCAIKWKNP